MASSGDFNPFVGDRPNEISSVKDIPISDEQFLFMRKTNLFFFLNIFNRISPQNTFFACSTRRVKILPIYTTHKVQGTKMENIKAAP